MQQSVFKMCGSATLNDSLDEFFSEVVEEIFVNYGWTTKVASEPVFQRY
jgi:long-subunit acyl-CoA synthetase (AMP-forming)